MQLVLAYFMASGSPCSVDVLQGHLILMHRCKAGLSCRSCLLAVDALLNLQFGGPRCGFWVRRSLGGLDGEASAFGWWHLPTSGASSCCSAQADTPHLWRRQLLQPPDPSTDPFASLLCIGADRHAEGGWNRPPWWQPEQCFTNIFCFGQWS